MEFSNLLIRQIEKIFGQEFRFEDLDSRMQHLLSLVDLSYKNADQERERTKYAFNIADQEFKEILDKLQNELDSKKRGFKALEKMLVRLQDKPVEDEMDFDLLIEEVKEQMERKLQVSEHLETTIKVIQEQNHQKSEFLSFLAHEIRAPLNVVLGVSQLLQDGDTLPEQRENLSILNSISNRTLELINNVLEFQKMESGKIKLNLVRENVDFYFHNLSETYQPIAQLQGIQLSCECDDRLSPFYIIDSFRIGQVLSNLISNSLKFTKKGMIKVFVKVIVQNEESDILRFGVEDTGIGMNAEELSNLFEKFAQANSSVSSEYGGSGLGLFFSNQMLKTINSDLKVESKKGVGSTFYFDCELDRTTEEKETPLLIDIEIPAGTKILIADDFQINQKVVERMLSRYNMESTVVSDGIEAVEEMKTNGDEYSIILMDINMPKMNGHEAAKEIRKFNKDIPIIALTASVSKQKEFDLLNDGIDRLEFKPFKLEHLLLSIKEELEKRIK